MCLSLATDALCCAGSTFCSLACCCCKSLFGTTFKEQVKLTYILLIYFVMIFTVIGLYYLQEFYSFYVKFIGCPVESGGSDLCLGVSGVYRMSFVLCVHFFAIMFCMLFRGAAARDVNEGFWALKILFIVGAFYGSLYIPNTFFEGYIDVAAVCSGCYMFFQIVIYIDIFYRWAENWVRQYDEGIECMGTALIVAAVVLFSGTCVLLVYNLIWFDNYFVNILTIVLIAACLLTQLLGFNQSGSLIVTGALSLYMTFQVFSALSSYPDRVENPFFRSKGNLILQMVIGALLNLGALAYMVFATQEASKQQLEILDSEEDKEAEQPKANQTQPMEIELTYDQRIAEARVLIEQDELRPYKSNQYVKFHLIMMFTSMYMSMMITNWGAPNINAKTRDIFNPSWLSYYMKLGSAWTCGLLYIWTLVAPGLFPERFNQN